MITGPAARAMLKCMIERSRECGGRLLLDDEILEGHDVDDTLGTFLRSECQRNADNDGWIIPTEKLEKVLREASLQ